MSYFSIPRVYFNGFFTTNVSTANNDRVVDLFDVETLEINEPWASQPDDTIRQAMMGIKVAPDIPPSPPDQKAIWLNGYFNYFGDHGTIFQSTVNGTTNLTTVRAAQTSVSGLITPNMSSDPLLGAQVELLGHGFFDQPDQPKMVDLNPVGTFGTQIFSGEFRITATINGQSVILLQGRNPTVAFIRYLGGPRNLNPNLPDIPRSGPAMGQAMWQSAIANTDITANTAVSPLLQTIMQNAAQGQGLMFCYCTYFCVDGIREDQLAQEFKDNNYQAIMNAGYGKIAGTLGVWSNDDLITSSPIARFLFNDKNVTAPEPLQLIDDPKAPLTSGADDQGFPLQPAFATVDTTNKIVNVNLLITIPEADSNLTKLNLGSLTLWTTYQGQNSVVGTINYQDPSGNGYDKTSYELNSGFVQVSYKNSSVPNIETAIQNGQLWISYGAQNTSVLREITYMTTETDNRCIYTQVGESGSCQVQLYFKGAPMQRDFPLTIEEWAEVITSPGDDHNLPGRGTVQQTGANAMLSYPTTVYTDNNGIATIPFTALQPGCTMLRIVAPGDTPGQFPDFPYYFSVRIFPNDNYDNIPDSQLTWDFVYSEVIRYYYLLYPGMFERLAFQNEDVARSNATLIKTIISPRGWESTAFMPVTREMSDGKRKLLQRWCALNE